MFALSQAKFIANNFAHNSHATDPDSFANSHAPKFRDDLNMRRGKK